MARTLSYKIVSSKMDILVEQRNYLQTFVDETNKVVQLATSWLRNEDLTNNVTYTDINKMIDDKLAFLVSTDFSVGCEETTTEQESVAARSFPPASTSTDQPLLAGHGHVSGVPVASDEIKTVLSQVNVMQDAMSFLSSSSKNLSEKQLAMEKLVESLSDKYSKMEQEKLREVERELESIKEKQKKASLQQDKRMTSFERKIQEVTDSQSDIMENCHQQQSKIREHKKENEKLKTQSEQFTKDLNDVLENIQELNTRISVLENQAVNSKQLQTLGNKVDIIEKSLDELSVKFEEHGLSLKDLSVKFEEHGSSLGDLFVKFEKHGSSLEDLSVKFVEHGSSLEDLSVKFVEHDSSLEEITRRTEETLNGQSFFQEIEFEQLQKFEEKISALEKSWSETSIESEKLYRDVETKYKMVCQVVIDRLLPLERLRNIFNEKLDARKEHKDKLDNICDQMAVIVPKVVQVEMWTQRQDSGFSARVPLIKLLSLRQNETIKFPDVISNVGNNYDPTTGEFTASLDGLYAVYLSFQIKGQVDMKLCIQKMSCSCLVGCTFCSFEMIDRKLTSSSSCFVLIEMEAADRLVVKSMRFQTSIFDLFDLIVSCYKIN